MTNLDFNPFPLGAIAPTSGTPLTLLTNFSDLAFTHCKVITIYAPAANTGAVYVGRSTMNKSTLAGVVLVVAPGETLTIPYDQSSGNMLSLAKLFVDVATTGDKALAVALFA